LTVTKIPPIFDVFEDFLRRHIPSPVDPSDRS
jgi:hypothetical protein